jgi:hypothetical protein
MRAKLWVLISVIFLIFNSCNKEENQESIECVNFAEALVYLKSDSVKIVIDKLTQDLNPDKKENDQWGHKENVNLLIKRLNAKCTNVTAFLGCYACIKTDPPQSEIILSVDSLEDTVKRVVEIFTPDDDVLKYVSVHE